MKTLLRTCALAALVAGQTVHSALVIPSDGSDGALVITGNTVIDLSQAATGTWNADNTANVGKGIYDPEKWAVVFKYSSVTIQAGATVTFKNHPSRAPIVWLVQGNVTIGGTVSLNGNDGLPAPALAEPGPGGFRPGISALVGGIKSSAGFGPGGGRTDHNTVGAGGSFGGLGQYGSGAYGNASLVPLIGGSGGGGAHPFTAQGGPGAGGGAMLIATSAELAVDGQIKANGGKGFSPAGDRHNGSGSGGGIRLIADRLLGGGAVQAIGGQGPNFGGIGRIRVERRLEDGAVQFTPPDRSVVTLDSGARPAIWLPEDGPSVRVISIGGQPVPTDPRAGFGAISADCVLPEVSSTTVVLETTNVEQASVVSVRATPRSDGNFSATRASVTEVINEDPLVVRWSANVPVKVGYSAIQVQVVRP